MLISNQLNLQGEQLVMIYTIYQVTNIVNHKIYIGVHKTNNPNDSYMGSGRAIKNAIKKYGKENFKKEVLFVFENKEDAYKKEQDLVNTFFISREDTYNGKLGGYGGWDHVRSPEVQKLAVERLNEYYQSDAGIKLKKHLSNSKKGSVPNDNPKINKWSKSEKNKQNLKECRLNAIWINNGQIEKSILKTNKLPEGWKRGRIIGNHKGIAKKYHLIDGDKIEEIFNLKNWCKEKKLNYNTLFSLVGKGIISISRKSATPTRHFMIGKEIKPIS